MDIDALRERVVAAPAVTGSPLDDWHASLASAGIHTLEPTELTWESAAHAVDGAIDAGIGGVMLIDDTTPDAEARAISALYCGQDATSVIPDHLSDMEWMQLCAQVRDAMPGLRREIAEPPSLLMHSPRLAWHVAAILHGAARRTPVLLAGALPAIAGLCAQRAIPLAATWIHIGVSATDPAAIAAEARLKRPIWFTSALHFSAETTERLLRAVAERVD